MFSSGVEEAMNTKMLLQAVCKPITASPEFKEELLRLLLDRIARK